ncbi:MAG TPA: MFS transporter [Blastocatellia bacterium]|nr:MFS transporter [Blastocatellia bacterium]
MEGNERSLYYGWVVVAACFVVSALISPLISQFSVFQVAMRREFDWSRGSIALALFIHLLLNGIASLFAAKLIHRFGARRMMPLGAVLTGLALIGLSRATALWHLYLAYGVIAAVGSSLLHVVPLTTIVSNWFSRRRGTAIGLVSAGSGVGQLLLPVMQYLINHLGWRQTYLTFGAAVMIIPSAVAWMFLDVQPESRRESSSEAPEVEWTVRLAVRSFRFWALTLVMALFAGGFFLISVQLVAYLEDQGYGSLTAATIVGLQGGLNMIGKFIGGLLCDRFSREKTLTLSIAIFVVGIALLNLAGSVVSQPLIYAFVVCYGIGFGMAIPSLMTSAADLFQGRNFGSILGIIVLGGLVGGALGAWLSGHFFDLTRSYQVNFLVSSLAMLLAGALIWKAQPGRPHRAIPRAPSRARD